MMDQDEILEYNEAEQNKIENERELRECESLYLEGMWCQ